MEPRIPKKPIASKEENNCKEEINLTPEYWCKCGCECKPMATFAESFCLYLQLKSRSARGAFHHSAFMGNCPTILFCSWC